MSLNEWFCIGSTGLWIEPHNPLGSIMCWQRWGIKAEKKQMKGGSTDQNLYIPTILRLRWLTFLHYSPLRTQLSNHLSTSSLRLAFPQALDSAARTPGRLSVLFYSLAKATGAAVASESPQQKHYSYWAPRSASRLGRLHWHRPLFVLAQCIKAAFLMSDSSVFDSQRNTVTKQQGAACSDEMCQYVRRCQIPFVVFSLGHKNRSRKSWGCHCAISAS